MRERMLVGLVASIGAVLLPYLMMGAGTGQRVPEAVETAAVEAPSPSPSGRQVSAIVIHQAAEAPEETDDDAGVQVTVQVEGADRTMGLEDYLTGVLLGEMPVDFPLEALKAQAVAARTYTVRRLAAGGTLSDDPGVCQAYADPGTVGEAAAEKLRQAVRETDGQVLTYEGQLISAVYFSCSGGRTESAQAVWGGEVPYLVSVDSPGEEDAAGYRSEVRLPLEEFLQTLDIPDAGVSEVRYTDGGGVDTITIGGKTFSGTEMRSLLGLRSTSFTLSLEADTVTIEVRGFGHRVGLSQYGAKAMAETGKTYGEILGWYYPGTTLETMGA